MPPLFPCALEQRLADAEARITRLENGLKELKAGGAGVRTRLKTVKKEGKLLPVKHETLDHHMQLWNLALQFAKQDANDLIEEANENLEAAERMILNRRRVEKGTYLHSRSMRYFMRWMKDWPPDCTSVLPETSEQRAEELQAMTQWGVVGTLPLLDEDDIADHDD